MRRARIVNQRPSVESFSTNRSFGMKGDRETARHYLLRTVCGTLISKVSRVAMRRVFYQTGKTRCRIQDCVQSPSSPRFASPPASNWLVYLSRSLLLALLGSSRVRRSNQMNRCSKYSSMKLLKIAKLTKLGEQKTFVRLDRRRFVGFLGVCGDENCPL